MSLIPAFEIGVWNAWVLSLIFLFVQFVPLALLNLIYKGTFKKAAAPSSGVGIDRFINLVMIIAFVYSIFLPLKLGEVWFYTGIPLFALGLVMLKVAYFNFASTPPDEPSTKGLYRFSRNPLYLAMFLVFIGISIASASWVFLLVSVILMVLINISVAAEEQFCLEKYGDAYAEYMKRIPRWPGWPVNKGSKINHHQGGGNDEI